MGGNARRPSHEALPFPDFLAYSADVTEYDKTDQPPAPRPRGRPAIMTEAVKVAVCEHVAKNGWNRGAAAIRAGCSTSTLDRAVRADPDFADALDAARGAFLATLEAEAYRRAVEGVETVKSLGKDGEPITVRVYSDALLSKLLVANGPEKHGNTIRVDKRVSGRVDHAHSARIDVASLKGEDRAALRGLLQRNRITVEPAQGGDDGGEG